MYLSILQAILPHFNRILYLLLHDGRRYVDAVELYKSRMRAMVNVALRSTDTLV